MSTLVFVAQSLLVVLALLGLAVTDFVFIRLRVLRERRRAMRSMQLALCSGGTFAALGASVGFFTTAMTAGPSTFLLRASAALMILGLVLLLIALAFGLYIRSTQTQQG